MIVEDDDANEKLKAFYFFFMQNIFLSILVWNMTFQWDSP